MFGCAVAACCSLIACDDGATNHYNVGNACQRQGEYDEAVAAYQAALRIDPTDSDTHNGLGNVYSDQGRLDDAIAVYREALRANPDYAPAHYNLACYHSIQGELSLSPAALRRAIVLDQKFSEMATTHSDFDSTRDTPGFQALMAEFAGAE